MQAHFLRYSCEIFTTKTCYVENKNIRLSIEKMRKRRIAMLRMRMCCCRISGGGSSNRLFTTGGFIIVPPSCTITSYLYFFFYFIIISFITFILICVFPFCFSFTLIFITSCTSTRPTFIFPNFPSFPLFLSLFCSLLLSFFRCSFIVSFYFNSRISTNSPNNSSATIDSSSPPLLSSLLIVTQLSSH